MLKIGDLYKFVYENNTMYIMIVDAGESRNTTLASYPGKKDGSGMIVKYINLKTLYKKYSHIDYFEEDFIKIV